MWFLAKSKKVSADRKTLIGGPPAAMGMNCLGKSD